MYRQPDRFYRQPRRIPIWGLILPLLLLGAAAYTAYQFLIIAEQPLAQSATPTPQPTPTPAVASLLTEAQEASAAGRFNAAIAAYRYALDAEPNQTEVYLELARLLILVGQPERGLMMAREALQRQPQNARAWALLGLAYDWLDFPDEAIAAAQKSVALAPTFPEGYAYLAEAYIDNGDWYNANLVIATALELGPQNPDVLRNSGYVLENQGNYTAAIAEYRRALEISPNMPHVYLSIARNANALGDPAIALEAYREAARIDPTNATVMDRLGWTYMLAGDYEQAQSLLEQAIQLDPTLGDAYGHLGTLYFQNRNYEDAITVFKPAVRYGEARGRRRVVFFVITESDAPNTPGREVARAEFFYPAQFDIPLRGWIVGSAEFPQVRGSVRLDVMGGHYAIQISGLPPTRKYMGQFQPLRTPEDGPVRTPDLIPTADGQVAFEGDTGPVKGPAIETYYTLALCYYLVESCYEAQPYIEVALRIDPNDLNAQRTAELCAE